MAGNETILVKTNTLLEDYQKLRNESLEKLDQEPPTKSGNGYMANKLDEMVQNMKVLHEKAIELISATATMLEKIGLEFEDMDQTVADVYKRID